MALRYDTIDQAFEGERFAGYLYFIKHPQGIIVVDGSLLMIDIINNALPIKLDQPAQAADYMRFYCAARHYEEGVYRLFEFPEQLLPSKALAPEDAARAQGLAKMLTLTTAATGDDWQAEAVVKYGSVIYNCNFRIERSGKVHRLNDTPLATGLSVAREVFRFGVRCLTTVNTEEKPAFKDITSV